MPGCNGTGTAERSYPTSEVGVAAGSRHPASEVRGSGREELPRIQGQWQPGEDTPCPRSGAARRSHLAPEARGGGPEEPPLAEAKGGSWEETPMPEAMAGGREKHPEEQWLHRCRRA